MEVVLTVTLENSGSSCAVLSGYDIYLWQCNAAGEYSLYGEPDENYLRGVQTTNSAGQVTFTTIFPACYSGRYPHMHIEVYSSLSSSTTGKSALLTTQLAMPRDIASSIYSTDSTLYANSTTNLAAVTTSSDLVFSSSSSSQLAQQTPSLSGSVSGGYTASVVVALSI